MPRIETWRSPEMDSIKLPGRKKESKGGIRVVNKDELPKPRRRGVGRSRVDINKMPEEVKKAAVNLDLEGFMRDRGGRKGLTTEGPKNPKEIN